MRRAITVVISAILAVLLASGAGLESCEDKKRAAQKPNNKDGGGKVVLPRTIVVSATASATAPGFHWDLTVQGGNYRVHSGTERTLDLTAQRIEVVEGQDVRVEFRAATKSGAVLGCKLTVMAGLQKASNTGTGAVSCSQNVSALFDGNAY